MKKLSKFRISGRRERAAMVLVVGALVAVAVVAIGRQASGGSSVAVLTPTFKNAQGVIHATGAPSRLTAGENESGDGIRARDDDFFSQRAYPAQHTPVGALERASQEANALRQTSPSLSAPATNIIWTKVGPQPIATIGLDAASASGQYTGKLPLAGRVSSIAPDPANSNVVYVGGAAGGVWKSLDGGGTWTPKFPTNQPSFSIGAIAVDNSNTTCVPLPSSCNIWVGTGEANGSGDTYYGQGIYKSANGGTTWTKVGGTQFDGCFVSDLVVVNSTTIVAAINEFPGVPNPACTTAKRGVWRTINGGTSWTKTVLPSSLYQAPSDFSQVPGSPQTIWLATYIDGIYKSTNGGASFSRIVYPTGGSPYRGVISAFNANVVYWAYSDTTSTNDLLWSVFKTIDGGAHWNLAAGGGGTNTPCTYPGTSTGGQCSYDFALAVRPTDSTQFFLGGIRMYRYTGCNPLCTSATPIGYGGYNGAGTLTCPGCIHVDQHAATFDSLNRLWVGNDGGVYRTDSTSNFATFLNRNGSGLTALAITEFGKWTSGSIPGGVFLGGTQDNGTVKYTTLGGLNWRMDHGGDGGATAYESPTTYYASYYGSNVYKTTNGGTSYSNVSGFWGGDQRLFYPPLEMSPASTAKLYRGTNRIWRTINSAASWQAISPTYSVYGSKVSAIGLATNSDNVIYAGWTAPTDSAGNPTGTTKLRYTKNATNASPTWTAVAALKLPDRFITDINVNPTNTNNAFVTFSGFGTGHIYRTTDGGLNWTNVSGNLPNVPVNSVAVDYSKTPARLFVGTDAGVLWSIDGGATWGNTSIGLPNTVVMDLRIDNGFLVAATHGRSAFKAPLPL